MKINSILGLNARSYYSYRYNKPEGKNIAASKLKTKKVLGQAGIAVPEIYARFIRAEHVLQFDWEDLPSSFALKPSRGLGGEGIVIAKKRAPSTSPSTSSSLSLGVEDPSSGPKGSGQAGWVTTQREIVTQEDLKLHILDILEGAYSLGNVPAAAFIEEYVGRHKAFRKYSYRGTPDIRVIIFNKVPVMAMLRLATRESGGKANLYQGAVAVGIDIATGITSRGFWHGKVIKYKPGTKRKLHGIKIPFWNKVLETAVACQEAVKLGYLGVDIVLHPERGPMVLEVNSQPGLKIQLANRAGLKGRIDRVEGITIRDAEHGIKVAKALFAGPFVDRVRAEEGIKTVNVFEKIKIKGREGKRHAVEAKLDTGAWRTSIDKTLAQDLGLLASENVLWRRRVRSSLGVEERPVIGLVFWLTGRKIETNANIANRRDLKKKVVIGRKALKGFLVSPEIRKD